MSATLPGAAPPLPPDKIRTRHRDRNAVVYVRRSTVRQVRQHQESTRLHYAPADRARQSGWGPEQVVVIGDDLGRSSALALDRPGFRRLVAKVGLGHVGLVLGIGVSRLARSCREWHQLLEMRALFDTLIADADGLYDPGNYNDRLVLGLKGTMSEAELHGLKAPCTRGACADAWRRAAHLARADGRRRAGPDQGSAAGPRSQHEPGVERQNGYAVEEVFAKLKEALRAAAARTTEALWAAVGEKLAASPPNECARYLAQCGYVQSG